MARNLHRRAPFWRWLSRCRKTIIYSGISPCAAKRRFRTHAQRVASPRDLLPGHNTVLKSTLKCRRARDIIPGRRNLRRWRAGVCPRVASFRLPAPCRRSE
ncbi:hypothetical protein KCP70_16950 [Salmonella enterica subsp. enterica]|nr:hypothetical protein KCP70_16950 [Salmonella enterica subsp. enterica]